MSTSDLSAAGSSTYSSNTLHVGDGTWDNGRDDFLLPNLVGLNFATMQYNGMGNRFRNLPEYHTLITGHGVLAAITFLLVIPLAIWSAKFWRTGGRSAVKLHVYLQILTLFLTTVVLVLGCFAVGHPRSLTNPHHGIGVAIYTLIWVQFIYGYCMARMEKRRKIMPTRVPTKVWIHKLLGRAIALLGIVQIALGLTLYGSPKVLFILYSLWVTVLLVAYLGLDRWYYEKRPLEYGYENAADFYSDYGSYVSGSRTDYTQQRPPPRRPESRERDRSHWGRDLLAAGGMLGAYEAFNRRRMRKREEREQEELDAETRYDAGRRHRPPPALAPSTALSGAPSSRPSSRPPPGVVYGTGDVPHRPLSRPPPGSDRLPPPEDSRMSPQSWEDEKYSERPERPTWRDRILGAGAGIFAFEGARRWFNRRRRQEDDYVDSSSVGPGGHHNIVSQTDISWVEHGQAPLSPSDPRNRHDRVNIAGVQPMTPTQTPSRRPQRPRPSGESMYDEDSSIMTPRPGTAVGADATDERYDQSPTDGRTLRDSIASMGAIAGFREWNRARRERRERERALRIAREERANEEQFNRRNSMNYPRPGDAGGRRPSESGTLMTGEPGFTGSNPELSRTKFSSNRPDTTHPPLPPTAGAVPSVGGAEARPSTVGPSVSQQRIHETGSAYSLPPPPPGPPPGGIRPDYRPPEPGSLQMPQGFVEPNPSRLVSEENVAETSTDHSGRDTIAGASAGALFAGAASDLRSGRRRNSQSESPSRYHGRSESRNRLQKRQESAASISQFNTGTGAPSSTEAGPSHPPVNVRVKMHGDGEHVTFQRLTEEEVEAKRAARRAERRSRRRQSSVSDGLESDAPPGSNQRYRRSGPIRRSSDQPITNVPPPPTLSTSALGSGAGGRRPSAELNLPPTPAGPATAGGAPPPPTHSVSPQDVSGLSPPPAGIIGSGLSGSPGDAGTGTDVSAFAEGRRRRRAERARRLEAARGTGGGGGPKVEFS
jgi:hypothetical protein